MRILANIFDSSAVEKKDGVPVAFRIWRFGENQTDKGLTIFSARSAKLLLEEQARRGNRYSFDIDHGSLNPNAPIEARRGAGSHLLELRGTPEQPELWTSDCRFVDIIAAGLRKDPPEWLYFSSAYDVDPETREVVSYLNTALTNNPATWRATALATRSAQEQRMDLNSFLAALQELIAKAQTPAQASETPPPAPVQEQEKASEPPAPVAEKAPDCEEKRTTIAANRNDDQVMRLAAQVQALTAQIAAKEEKEERARLLASRPDFDKKVADALASAPLDRVRFAVETFPRVSNPAAAIGVQATRGAEQGASVSHLPENERRELDARMGVARRQDSIRRDGNHLVLGAMNPAEAREFLAKKGTE